MKYEINILLFIFALLKLTSSYVTKRNQKSTFLILEFSFIKYVCFQNYLTIKVMSVEHLINLMAYSKTV